MADNVAKVENVSVGKPKQPGAIFAAPADTAPPTDAVTPLAAAFKCLGYGHSDGVVNNNETDEAAIKAWGGDVVLKQTTSRDESLEFGLIEALSVEVLKTVYGPDHVKGDLDKGLSVEHTSDPLPRGVFAIEVVMSNGVIKRIVVPKGQISKVDSVSYKDDEEINYKCTLACYPDEKGVTIYEYMAKPKTVPGVG